MSNELSFTASATGFDKVKSSLNDVTKGLASVSTASAKLDSSLDKQKAVVGRSSQVLTDFSRIAQDAAFGPLAIANNISPLVESFGRLRTETGSVKGAISSLLTSVTGPGGLVIGISAISAAASFAAVGFSFWERAMGGTNAALDKKKSLISEINSGIAQEATQVNSLIAVLTSETETRKRKLAALEDLKRINPEIFDGLKLEGDAVAGLDAAYQKYIANLRNVVGAKLIQAQIEKEITNLLEIQGATLTKTQASALNGAKDLNKERAKQLRLLGDLQGANALESLATFSDNKQTAGIVRSQQRIKELTEQLKQFTSGISLGDPKSGVGKKILTVSDILAELQKELDFLDKKEVLFFTDENKNRINVIGSALNKLLKDLNLPTDNNIVQRLTNDIKVLNAYVDRENFAPKLAADIKAIPTEIKIPRNLKELAKPPKIDLVSDFRKQADSFMDYFNNTFADIQAEAISSFGEILSNVITGNFDNVKSVFEKLINTVGNFLVDIGKALIKIGVIKKALNSLSSLNPTKAIVLGLAAVVAGNILKSRKFAVGTRYAPGGLSLVGERGPELVSLPRGSQVTPAVSTANQLQGFGSGGGFILEQRISGPDLMLLLRRANGSYNRAT